MGSTCWKHFLIEVHVTSNSYTPLYGTIRLLTLYTSHIDHSKPMFKTSLGGVIS